MLAGGHVDNNTTTSQAGGIYNTGTISINGGSINSNTASGEAGGIYNTGTVTVNGGTVDNNVATSYGGGIYNYGGNLNIVSGSVNGNRTAALAGGIMNYGGTFRMTGGSVDNNNAGTSGGGVYNYKAAFTVTAGSINANTATNYGGGIYNSGGTLTVGGSCTINSNTATTKNGGGIYNDGGTLTVGGSCTINSNTATAQYGGGISSSNGKFDLSGGTISKNKTVANGTHGGGIHIVGGTFNVSGGTVSNNATKILGGGISIWSSTVTMTAGTIDSNYVESDNTSAYGGGIGIDKSKFTMSGGTVSNNYAYAKTSSPAAGGGFYLQTGSELEVKGNAQIINNRVVAGSGNINTEGGGIWLSASKLTISENAVISGNGHYEGAKDSPTCRITLASTLIAYGGGVYAKSSSEVVMNGGSITGNFAPQSGGIEISSQSTFRMSGGSITGNTAYVQCGGSHADQNTLVEFSGKAVIKDNIVKSRKGAEPDDITQKDENGYNSNFYLTGGELFAIRVLALDATAEIHLVAQTSYRDNKKALTSGYKANNKDANSIAKNPNTSFKSDRGTTFAVNADGEVVELMHGAELKADYADTPAVEAVSDCGKAYEYARGKKLSAEIWYNNAKQTASVKKGGADVSGDVTGAGVYTVTAAVDNGVEIAYTVVITPKDMSAVQNVCNVTGSYPYKGEPYDFRKVTFTLSDGDTTLIDHDDYTYIIKNSENAGQADIVVTYKGNYKGEATYHFTITPKDISYEVSWQYYDGTEWKAMPADKAPFSYTTIDYGMDIRAKLVADGKTAYVYARQTGETQIEDRKNTTNMYLEYAGQFDGTQVTSLLNATTYSVGIAGDANYRLDNDLKTIQVIIKPATLPFSETDFVESSDNRLWVMDLGGGRTANLLDKVVYYDSDPPADATLAGGNYGSHAVIAERLNTYARYSGSAIKIILNKDFVIHDGKTIADYETSFSGAPVYENNVQTGAGNTVNTFAAKAKIVFNGNFALGSNNFVQLPDKEWKIVTINNMLRDISGGTDLAVEGFTYGENSWQQLFRPEHGNYAIYTVKDPKSEYKFAVEYSGNNVSYYKVKSQNSEYVADLQNPIDDDNYLATVFTGLNKGRCTLTVAVPSYKADASHKHWWDNSAISDVNTVYYPISMTYNFDVGAYALSRDVVSLADSTKDVFVTLESDSVYYTGYENNVPDLAVTFKGKSLVKDVDYKLVSTDVNATRGATASFALCGLGNFDGEVMFAESYYIVKARNYWEKLPSIMYWTFGDYKKSVNIIEAKPGLPGSEQNMWFKITTDKDGNKPIVGLEYIKLVNGEVEKKVEDILKILRVSTYYLFATVDGDDNGNYYALSQAGVPFKVFEGVNGWDETPSVKTWVEGSYTGQNTPIAVSKFGTPIIVIQNGGVEVFNSSTGLDNLASLTSGTYKLSAYVDATADFSGLPIYTIDFEVFKKPGIPLWGTLCIAFGALLVAALILFILWKKGVFQILTGKITLAIRTRASIDATIASVRAAKRMEEGKRTVAEAQRLERIEAARQRALEQRAMSPEERAAMLEEKAQKSAMRAEKMRARSEDMRVKAEKLRETVGEETVKTDANVDTNNTAE